MCRDITFVNGLIYTLDSRNFRAQGLCISDGKITFIGASEEAMAKSSRGAEVIDLKDKILMPSFFEGHAHPDFIIDEDICAVMNFESSVEGYLRVIREFYKRNPCVSFLRGYGWDNAVFPNEGPTSSMLDEISQDIPIVIHSVDHHSLWVNSKAIEMSNADNSHSGVFREDRAMNLVLDKLPDYSVEDYKQSILNYQSTAHSYGYTGCMDAIVMPFSNCLKAYRELDRQNRLSMYFRGAIVLNPDKFEKQLEDISENLDMYMDGNLFKGNIVKFFVDGVIEGATAYLFEDYEHKPGFRGSSIWNLEQLIKAFQISSRLGFQIHCHTIGDAATALVLDAFEAPKRNVYENSRHALTHLQLVRESDFKRFKALGLIAAVNPYWAMREPQFPYIERVYLGDRAERMYPIHSFTNHDITIVSASDYPITLCPDPLIGIEASVRRQQPDALMCSKEDPLNPDEAISIYQAVKSFTYNPAYAYFLEDVTGSLEVGKYADMIVLDRDIFNIEDSKTTRVVLLQAYFHGKRVK